MSKLGTSAQMRALEEAAGAAGVTPQPLVHEAGLAVGPAGGEGDSGFVAPRPLAADVTVTFGFPKVGLLTTRGNGYAGRIVPVEIGFPAGAGRELPYEELRLRDVRAFMPERPSDANKGT